MNKNLKTRKMCHISYTDQYGMRKSVDRFLECKDMSISGIIDDFISKGYQIPTSFKVTEYDEVTVAEQKKEKKFYCNYKKPDDTDWVGLTFFNTVNSCNCSEFSAVSGILCSMQNLPNGTEFEVYSIENGITSLVQSGTVSTPQVLKKKFEIYIRGVHHCSWELLTSFVDDENVDTSKLLEHVLRYIKDVPKDTQYKVLDFNGRLVLSTLYMTKDTHILGIPIVLNTFIQNSIDTLSIRKQFSDQMDFIDSVLKIYKTSYKNVTFDWICNDKIIINFER